LHADNFRPRPESILQSLVQSNYDCVAPVWRITEIAQMKNDLNDVPKAAQVALLVAHPETRSSFGGEKVTVTLRLPETEAAFVDVLAKRINRSRNATVALMLQVAREEITGHMDDALAEEVQQEHMNQTFLVSVGNKDEKEGGL
jgi:hypothetical protein